MPSSSSQCSTASAFLLICCCINSTIGQNQPNTIIDLSGYACATSETDLSQVDLSKTGNAKVDSKYSQPIFKPLSGMAMDATITALTPCLSVQTLVVRVEAYNPDELPPEATMVTPDNRNSATVPSCKSIFNGTVKLPNDICQIYEETVSCEPWTDSDYEESYSLKCNSTFKLRCGLPGYAIAIPVGNYSNIFFTYASISGYESKPNFPCQYIFEAPPGYRLLIPKDVPNSMPIRECLDQLAALNLTCPDPGSRIITSAVAGASDVSNSTTTADLNTTTPEPMTTDLCWHRYRNPYIALIAVTSLFFTLLIVLICVCLFCRCEKERGPDGKMRTVMRSVLKKSRARTSRTKTKSKDEETPEHPPLETKGQIDPSLEGENILSHMNDDSKRDDGEGIDVPDSKREATKGRTAHGKDEEYNKIEDNNTEAANEEIYANLEATKPPEAANEDEYAKLEATKPPEAANEDEYANLEAISNDDRVPEELYSNPKK